MIGLGISIILFITLCVYYFKKRKEDGNKEGICGSVLSVTCFFLFSLVIFIVIDAFAMLLLAPPATTIKRDSGIVQTDKIIALKDVSEEYSKIYGSMYLFLGTTTTEDYYVYYAESENGYKRKEIESDNRMRPVYIKSVAEGEEPHVDYYYAVESEILTNKANPIFSISNYSLYEEYEVGDVISREFAGPLPFKDDSYYDDYKIVVYIPEEAMVSDFVVDLE